MSGRSIVKDVSPVLIVGAGPAGLSCALWLHNLGLRPWLIDRAGKPGGLLNLNTLQNNWVLGQMHQTGPLLAEQFSRHVASLPVTMSLGVEHFEVKRDAGGFEVRTWCDSVPRESFCSALVLTTGTRVRGRESLADVAGLEEMSGLVRYGPSAFDALSDSASGCTLIIGGGDNAVENARMILAQGGEVVMAARSGFRAQAPMMAWVAAHPRAQCLSNNRLLAIRRVQGDGDSRQVFAAELAGPDGVRTVSVNRLHVLTGYEPNSNFAQYMEAELWHAIRRDSNAYLCVDAGGRSSAAGIYAAGDVCNPIFPSVVSAIAQGALVAKTIEQDLRLADPAN